MSGIYAQEQVEGLYRKTFEMLRDYQIAHYLPFEGELHFNTADYQLIANEAELRRAREENRTPRRHTVVHGEKGTIFGTNCVADDQTPMGCVGMGES